MHIMRVLFVAAVVGAWLLGMGGLGWGSYEPKRRYPLTEFALCALMLLALAGGW